MTSARKPKPNEVHASQGLKVTPAPYVALCVIAAGRLTGKQPPLRCNCTVMSESDFTGTARPTLGWVSDMLVRKVLSSGIACVAIWLSAIQIKLLSRHKRT